jgi:PKD repeat protein
MTIDFLSNGNGLVISFRSILSEVPLDITYLWDFSDVGTSTIANPSHTFSKAGFYNVTLTVTYTENSVQVSKSITYLVVVSDKVITTLSDTIYNLINSYIPESLLASLTFKDKRVYIQKWQLYLYPLVNHIIDVSNYNDELYYEALENQLVMELAAYEWLKVNVLNLLNRISNISINTSGSQDDKDVKKITTGPTEVEFYASLQESNVTLYKLLTNALQPGGVIDTIRKDICMLSSRLEIYLPICTQHRDVVIPRVVNKRINKPDFVDGRII